MGDDDALFPAVPATAGSLSADQRRSTRAAQAIAFGWHPLRGIPLHPDAPADRDGAGPRCGSCAHLIRVGHHNRVYLKCDLVPLTHGPGTDARSWWPACSDWELRP